MSGKAPEGEGPKQNAAQVDSIVKLFNSIKDNPFLALASLVVVLVVAWALGGLSWAKIQNIDPEHSNRIMGVAIALAFVALMIHLGTHVQSLTLPFFVVLAAIFTLVVVAPFFNWIRWPTEDRLHETMDHIIVCLAAVGWFGIVPAYLTARFVSGLPKTVEEHLTKLKKKEDDLVEHIEDATRSSLKGFPQIFQKALSLICESEAGPELIFVNFALNFGHPHIVNTDIVREYKKLSGNDFEADVVRFLDQLKARIFTIKEAQILTVSGDAAKEQLLRPLKDRSKPDKESEPPYSRLDVDEESQALERAKRDVRSLIRQKAGKILETRSLPVQLLIIGLPPRTPAGDRRVGCLVFMVGSEIMKGLASGDEAGFYTELPSMVAVFRSIALALIRDAENQEKAITAEVNA